MQTLLTMEQIIYKTKTTVMCIGLYPTDMLKRNNFLPANQSWPKLKLHLTKAYDLHVCTGRDGIMGANGYHGVFNTTDDVDGSLALIQASIQY